VKQEIFREIEINREITFLTAFYLGGKMRQNQRKRLTFV
jgi:hypothetical protein